MRIPPYVIEVCRDESGAVMWNAAALLAAVMILCQAEYHAGSLAVLFPSQEVPESEFRRVSGLREPEALLAARYITRVGFPLHLHYTAHDTVRITADWNLAEECLLTYESTLQRNNGLQRGLPILPARDSTARSTFPPERYRKILSEYARLHGIQLRQLPQGQIARARASLKRLFRTGVPDEDVIRGMHLLHELSRYRLYFRNWSIPTLEQHWQRYISGDLARELREAQMGRRDGAPKLSVTETLQMLREKITSGH